VAVTDERGEFVTGLAREDFEVLEDGKPQKVDTFSYVEIPLANTATKTTRPRCWIRIGLPCLLQRASLTCKINDTAHALICCSFQVAHTSVVD
jgi:hypothetical protein